METPHITAYNKGKQAYRLGVPKHQNPYSKETLAHAWDTGWKFAQANPTLKRLDTAAKIGYDVSNN